LLQRSDLAQQQRRVDVLDQGARPALDAGPQSVQRGLPLTHQLMRPGQVPVGRLVVSIEPQRRW